MNRSPDKTETRIFVGGTAFYALCCLIFLPLYYNYIFSTFLYFEDNSFITWAAFGDPQFSLIRPRKFLVTLPSLLTGSIAASKFANYLIVLLAPAAAFAVLKKIGATNLLAGALAFAIFAFPLSVSQPFYVSGSHPLMGSVCAIMAIYVFLGAEDYAGRTFYLRLGLSFLLMIGAWVCSPVFALAPFTPMLWLIALSFVKPVRWRETAILAGMILIPALLLVLTGYRAHKFRSSIGWAEYSVGQILMSPIKAIHIIAAKILGSPAIIIGVYGLLACALAVVAFFAVRAKKDSNRGAEQIGGRSPSILFAVLITVITAALAFGPAAIMVILRERYFLAAFLLTALAAAMLIVRFFPYGNPRLAAALSGLLIAAGVSNFWLRAQEIHNQHGPQLATHRTVEKIAADVKAASPGGAQILVIADPPANAPTIGHNHWSTWYLRALTDSESFSGLIGMEKMISDDPFVLPVYKTRNFSGEQFRAQKTHRSRRIKMKGLERGQPLYAYVVSLGDTDTQALPVIFRQHGVLYDVMPGQRPCDAVKSPKRVLKDGRRQFLWPVQVELYLDECE